MSTPGKKEDNPFSFTNIFAEDTPPAPKPKAKKKVCNRYFETSRLRCYPGLCVGIRCVRLAEDRSSLTTACHLTCGRTTVAVEISLQNGSLKWCSRNSCAMAFFARASCLVPRSN